jgi:hypothetical protein
VRHWDYNSPLEPPKSLWQKVVFVLLLLYIIGGAVCFTIAMLSAAAASPCMTQAQARRVHPDRHLWWHPRDDGAHCWDGNGPRSSGGRSDEAKAREVTAQSRGRREPDDLQSAGQAGVGSERTSPPEAVPPPPTFIDRWPETMAAISPLRWSRELMEFGTQTGR